MHHNLTSCTSNIFRQNTSWRSRKSKLTSAACGIIGGPNTSIGYRAWMPLSPRAEALIYQLCILCISHGISAIAQSGNNGLPHSYLKGHTPGISGISSTPIVFSKFVSVRGTENPDRWMVGILTDDVVIVSCCLFFDLLL